MMKHVEQWKCEAGHGLIREYRDPEYAMIGNAKVYVNSVADGDPCNHAPVFITQGISYEVCKAPMRLEREEVTE
jgi:hypothetical protein